MLTLTRKTEYGLLAMVDLAQHGSSTVTASDIAKRLRMPLPALRQILTGLMHRGLAVSVRGAHGGYRLARPAETITLSELIDAIEGPFRLTPCSGPQPYSRAEQCRTRDICVVSGAVRKVHDLLERCLTDVTIADLALDTVPVISSLAAYSQSTDGQKAAANE